VLSQLPVLAAGMVVMVMSIYFLLADGPRLLAFVREKTTLPKRQLDRLINAFATMCRSVILASVVSGVIQSVLFGVAAAFVGTLNGLVVGFMVFISSFIPLIGTAPVTVGAALHQFVTGQNVAGVTFLIFALVVAVVDNFVRPMIYKGSGDLHPLLGFIAAFGGLFVLGFSGVFLGPVVAGLFVVTVEQLLRGD
jgi:predicted PurR-regulated permease PerM